MTDPTIAQQWGDSMQRLFNTQNATVYANYQNVYQNWTIQQLGQPPAPPQLIVFNEPLAIQLYTAWSNAFSSMTPNGPAPTFDLSPAISYVQAAAILPPAPVAPPPTLDPVGPPQGSMDGLGRPMYYNTATSGNFPNGGKCEDSRGTFEHVVISTPFGSESYWALLPPVVT